MTSDCLERSCKSPHRRSPSERWDLSSHGLASPCPCRSLTRLVSEMGTFPSHSGRYKVKGTNHPFSRCHPMARFLRIVLSLLGEPVKCGDSMNKMCTQYDTKGKDRQSAAAEDRENHKLRDQGAHLWRCASVYLLLCSVSIWVIPILYHAKHFLQSRRHANIPRYMCPPTAMSSNIKVRSQC
jgi:hypothetical protein